ncbi:unnamed protein product [Parnassius apollo]|uniref:(apollo) hypothetical protein n=1 Tax=Parnassius apollo TaxID=110799 RepID=A0A8S3X1M2_PARAO|nr:unnamed protein product [Parnassius apollo]
MAQNRQGHRLEQISAILEDEEEDFDETDDELGLEGDADTFWEPEYESNCVPHITLLGGRRDGLLLSFFHLFNVFTINKFVIYNFNNNEDTINRRIFLKLLSTESVKAHRLSRAIVPSLPSTLKKLLLEPDYVSYNI